LLINKESDKISKAIAPKRKPAYFHKTFYLGIFSISFAIGKNKFSLRTSISWGW